MSNDENKPEITVTMLDGRCKVSYGDQAGGRYVLVDYDDIRPYILGEKPRAELVEIYHLAD